MIIHGQLTKETYNQIKAGAVSEFPLEDDFIKTDGGIISSQELLVLIYQTFGDKPFTITILSSDASPVTNLLHKEFLSGKLMER